MGPDVAFRAALLLPFLSLVLLLTPAAEAAKCFNPCNGTETSFTSPECELTIPSDAKYPAICKWTISNVTGPLTFLIDDDLRLIAQDVLTISVATKEGTATNVTVPGISQILGKRGVVFTDAVLAKDQTLVVVLSLAKERPGQAHFGIRYSTSASFDLPVEEHATYHIPITAKGQTWNGPIASVSINLPVKGGVPAGKIQVIEMEEITGSPDAKFEGSQTPAGFDVMAVKDAKKPITLTLSKFDPAASSLVFTMDLVDSECSRYVALGTTKEEFKVEGSLTSANCLLLVDSDKPVRIDYSKLVSLLGPSDLITVQSGGSEYQSPILAVLSQQNLGLKNDTRVQVVPGGKVRLSYTSHFVADKAGQVLIAFSQSPLSKVEKVDKDTALILKSDGSDPDPLVLIEVPAHLKAGLTIGDTKPRDVSISFYSSPDTSSSQPFLTLAKGYQLPSLVVSPSNVLRISFSGAADVSGTASVVTGANATAIGDSDSIALRGNDVPAGSSATWLIPARASTSGYLALDIQALILDGEGACVTLQKLGKEVKQLVKECWDKDLASNSNQNKVLPKIMLHPAYSYTLTYGRSQGSRSGNTLLFSASFSYSPVNGCNFDRTLGTQDALVISSDGYPSQTPVTDIELYTSVDPRDACGWRINASTPASLVHAVFQDLDLKSNQSLVLASNGSTAGFAGPRKGLPDDLIAPQSLMMHLKTPLDRSSNVSSLSGRGFQLSVTEVACGGTIDLSKNKSLATPGFPAATNASLCLWLVKGSKDLVVLNISKTFGSGDQKDGLLTIYDAGHTRNRVHMVNTTNATALSSVDTIMVEYRLKQGSKSAPGLNLTFVPKDCASLWNGTARSCGDHKRCILPAWNCDGVDDCGDNFDEIHCNVTIPVPPPPPPHIESGGVSGWVIVLLIIPMSIGVGVLLTLFGPLLLTRLRGARYSEFRNFASEDT